MMTTKKPKVITTDIHGRKILNLSQSDHQIKDFRDLKKRARHSSLQHSGRKPIALILKITEVLITTQTESHLK